MGYQRLSQTRKPQAYSQPQGEKRANYSPHPIEELQGGIGNRAMERMLQAQEMSQDFMVRKPLFRGLSHEWEGKKKPGEIPVQAQLDETGKEGIEERAEVNTQPSMGVRKPLFRGLSYEWEGKKPQRGIPVQAKLMVGKADDRFEEEADRVAAEVVQQIDGQAPQPLSQGEMVQREEMEEERLQRKQSVASLSVVEGGMAAPAELERAIQGARGSGQPLAESVREPMEQAFGADFSGVRVHKDAQSDALNQSLSSRAFTTGEDIFFRQGEYEPGSLGGQELLAHELTHVVQQSGGAVQQVIETTGKEEGEIKRTNVDKKLPEINSQKENQGKLQRLVAKAGRVYETRLELAVDKAEIEEAVEVLKAEGKGPVVNFYQEPDYSKEENIYIVGHGDRKRLDGLTADQVGDYMTQQDKGVDPKDQIVTLKLIACNVGTPGETLNFGAKLSNYFRRKRLNRVQIEAPKGAITYTSRGKFVLERETNKRDKVRKDMEKK